MKKLLLILLLVPLVSFSQLENIYFSGIELVILTDNLSIVPVFQEKIIATSTFLPRYEGDYISIMTKGKIIDSLEAESEMDAVVKLNWEKKYMSKPGDETKNVLLKGEKNKYYIIKFKNQ